MRADRIEDLAPELLGLDMAATRRRGSPRPSTWKSERHQPSALPRRRRRARRAAPPALPRSSSGVSLLRDAGGAAHDRAERAVGLFAERRAGGRAARRPAEPLLVADARDEFATRRDLPMPASPTRRTSWAAPAQRPVEAVEHAAELGVAADQRRAEAERLEPAGRARRVERPDQPVHEHAAGLAAQRDVAQRFIGEGMAGRAGRSAGRPAPRRSPPSDCSRCAVFTVSPVTE